MSHTAADGSQWSLACLEGQVVRVQIYSQITGAGKELSLAPNAIPEPNVQDQRLVIASICRNLSLSSVFRKNAT